MDAAFEEEAARSSQKIQGCCDVSPPPDSTPAAPVMSIQLTVLDEQLNR
jgi:hypothetical protein